MEKNNVNSWSLKSPFSTEPTIEEIRKFISDNHHLANSGHRIDVPAKVATVTQALDPIPLASTTVELVPKLPLVQAVEYSTSPSSVPNISSNGNSYSGLVAFGIFLLIVGVISYLVHKRIKQKGSEKVSKAKTDTEQSSRYFSPSIFDGFENSEFGKIAKPLLIGLGYVFVAILILYASTALLRQTKSFVNEARS